MKASRVSLTAAALLFSPLALAQVPQLIHYQGRMLQGTNLVNGTVPIVFRLYGDAAGPAILFEQSNNVTVVDGLYQTWFGDFPNHDYYDLRKAVTAEALYLEVVVDGQVLSPRERVGSVAYALLAAGVTDQAITHGMIADDAVRAQHLQANSVAASEIQNESITSADILNGQVTSDDIANNSITSTDILNNQVNSDDLADGTIQEADLSSTLAGGTFWRLGGNSGTDPLNHFVGTTDNQPLEFRVGPGLNRGLRIQPAESPNLVGGYKDNVVDSYDTDGAAILSGGDYGEHNRIHAGSVMSVIAGGGYNWIGTGSVCAAILGGYLNWIDSTSKFSTVCGGEYNLIRGNAWYANIGGGEDNEIGAGGYWAAIGGGEDNFNAGQQSVVGGGYQNRILFPSAANTVGGGSVNTVHVQAVHSVIGGGMANAVQSLAEYATIPGGAFNSVSGSYSFAAGRRAKARHSGSFVWGDSTDADVSSSVSNEFRVRATGGVVFDTGTNALVAASARIGGAAFGKFVAVTTFGSPTQTILNCSGRGRAETTGVDDQLRIVATADYLEYTVFSNTTRLGGALAGGTTATFNFANGDYFRVILTDADNGFAATAEGNYYNDRFAGTYISGNP